jgi:hypothetical protein
MARTALTPVQLAWDAGVAEGSSGTVDATNGNIVPFATTGSPAEFGAYNVVLVVTNGDSASHTCIVRGSGYTGTPSGAANSGLPAPGAQPLAQAMVGDFSQAVANGTTEFIGPFTTDRFAQADGSLWVDWSASTSMSVWVLQWPTLAV